MASKYKMAGRATKKMMAEARRGKPQLSKTWGFGQKKRSVWIWFNENKYQVAFNVWGFPEHQKTGCYDDIYNQVVQFLAEAG